MKKALSALALFAVLLLTVSARSERVFMAAEGYHAPGLSFGPSDSAPGFSLDSMRGQYVLIDFWSVTDADSRIRTADHSSWLREAGAEQVGHMAVNTDRNTALFREIMRRDGLDAKTQHSCYDATNPGRLTDDWHLESGLRSFLIDPLGYIVAVNPSRETFRQLVGSAG